MFLQKTSSRYPERDRPLPVDFDGDWDATNNWSELTPKVLEQQPAAYFSAVLSKTHAYLTYTLFYPRDWIPLVCVRYACHDNDLEVVLVTVERTPASANEDGLVYVESKFHSKFVAEAGPKIARSRDGRPLVTVETEGHGMTPALASEELDLQDVVVLRKESSAPFPAEARAETYALLPLHSTLWQKRHPESANGSLWTAGDMGWLSYAGVRFGRLGRTLGATMAVREYTGGVRPPWGIDPQGNRGDWFFDPAFGALTRHAGFFAGAETSLEYELNPYLEDLARECAGAQCKEDSAEPLRSSLPATFPLTSVGLLLLGWRRRPRRPGSRSGSDRNQRALA